MFAQWFDMCDIFISGFAAICLNDKCNFINTKGEILSDQWFDSIGYFGYELGCAIVHLNRKWNFINTKGEILSDQWFDRLIGINDELLHNTLRNGFTKGCIVVELSEKYNLINTNGNLSSKKWFDYGPKFDDGFAVVQINGNKWNIVSENGELILDEYSDNESEVNDLVKRLRGVL